MAQVLRRLSAEELMALAVEGQLEVRRETTTRAEVAVAWTWMWRLVAFWSGWKWARERWGQFFKKQAKRGTDQSKLAGFAAMFSGGGAGGGAQAKRGAGSRWALLRSLRMVHTLAPDHPVMRAGASLLPPSLISHLSSSLASRVAEQSEALKEVRDTLATTRKRRKGKRKGRRRSSTTRGGRGGGRTPRRGRGRGKGKGTPRRSKSTPRAAGKAGSSGSPVHRGRGRQSAVTDVDDGGDSDSSSGDSSESDDGPEAVQRKAKMWTLVSGSSNPAGRLAKSLQVRCSVLGLGRGAGGDGAMGARVPCHACVVPSCLPALCRATCALHVSTIRQLTMSCIQPRLQAFLLQMRERRTQLITKRPDNRHADGTDAGAGGASTGTSPPSAAGSASTASPAASKSAQDVKAFSSPAAAIKALMMARRKAKSLRNRLKGNNRNLRRRVLTRTLGRGMSGRTLALDRPVGGSSTSSDESGDDTGASGSEQQAGENTGNEGESPAGARKMSMRDRRAVDEAAAAEAVAQELHRELLDEASLASRLATQVSTGVEQLHQLEADRGLYDKAVAAVARHQELVTAIQEKKVELGAMKLDMARRRKGSATQVGGGLSAHACTYTVITVTVTTPRASAPAAREQANVGRVGGRSGVAEPAARGGSHHT